MNKLVYHVMKSPKNEEAEEFTRRLSLALLERMTQQPRR